MYGTGVMLSLLGDLFLLSRAVMMLCLSCHLFLPGEAVCAAWSVCRWAIAAGDLQL